jgi:uncharacterized protein YwqG
MANLTQGNLRRLLIEHQLTAPVDQIVALAQPAIGLSSKLANETALALAASKIGGYPDLSPQTPWPQWEGSPLGFVMQINLADAAKFPFASSLPETGLLSFFYHAEQGTWGFDPKDKGSFIVVYTENLTDLRRQNHPVNLPKDAVYKCCSLDMGAELSLPDYNSLPFQSLKLNKEDTDKYLDVQEKFLQTAAPHRLLGFPVQIQGDMTMECQFVTNGIYCGGPDGYKEGRAQGLDAGCGDWQLLLQIGSDDNADMMWGDVGSIYYWIKKLDLAERRFENSWLVFQCS